MLAHPTPAKGIQTGETAPCEPTAFVSGEVEVVVEIRRQLAAAGVGDSPSGECPAVTAHVQLLPDGILVRIEDPSGRSSERQVSDAVAAATLIESWTRSEVSLDLFANRAAPAIGPASSTPNRSPGPAPEQTPEPTPAPAAGRLALLGEVSGGTDGSFWYGGRLAGCGTVGPTCLGGSLRGGYDGGLTGDSAAESTKRGALDLLFTVDSPVDLAAVTITPGIGLGAGWMHSTGWVVFDYYDDDDGEDDDDDGDDDDGNDDDEVLREVRRNAWGLRVDAHLGVSVHLGEQLRLALEVAAGWSTHGYPGPGDPRSDGLVGEPSFRFHGGVGLGYVFR